MLVPHHGGSVRGVLSARFRGGIGQFEGVFVSFCELSFYSESIFKTGAKIPPPRNFYFHDCLKSLFLMAVLFFRGFLGSYTARRFCSRMGLGEWRILFRGDIYPCVCRDLWYSDRQRVRFQETLYEIRVLRFHGGHSSFACFLWGVVDDTTVFGIGCLDPISDGNMGTGAREWRRRGRNGSYTFSDRQFQGRVPDGRVCPIRAIECDFRFLPSSYPHAATPTSGHAREDPDTIASVLPPSCRRRGSSDPSRPSDHSHANPHRT